MKETSSVWLLATVCSFIPWESGREHEGGKVVQENLTFTEFLSFADIIL